MIFARITPCAENGKITIVDFLNDGSVGVGSTEFIVLSPKLVSSEYLYHLCRTKRVHGYAIKRMAGTTGRQRIPSEVFDEIMIPLPPESEKMIIEKKIENAEKTVVTLLKKIEQAKCLKIAVFNALFAGGVERATLYLERIKDEYKKKKIIFHFLKKVFKNLQVYAYI